MHRYRVLQTAIPSGGKSIRVIFDSATKPKGQLVKALERVYSTDQMLEEAKFAVFVE
ncbi:hypothetical protein N9C25_01910 [Saprospiraceae bacterium]|jgi:hypothetical protein|nr:hypothetical protein [Saprospiraceae bacterium]MDA9182444.1 hypothetical protein [Saprospiraceae bacterium]MDA9625835.1 hypothetical protein [bacterium]MDA9872954.1 hypothetical protein [Saprospiraceae bacterium]